ncbi:MAG: NHLP bacteriocin export ABC transporter permease/ATPase subunit [Nostoc sp. DedVER02]|uniref:NHLP bacteriocin export ABC transporter permease/ATPase subunit n=1 Tax=unclassified Nostoc TaxID=2593658 RepID=UPI002AD2E07E|nr:MULTISPECIES: NHLP bacteriocin export ABC transporter permease/ATPase subunit [unclassified Nostoc]MDZ7989857.1 NHLP bacteriocin export ABC transporter permease/ATPase subunit [Nostoc sp. DedVER02]MDZ8111270.1 NHLP bacteriocin export ABC transporter permease/ATPase subunit [Nostoc sp. DedVER01b]
MLDQIRIASLSGEYYQFKGNEPIILNDPETIWVVKSGSLAVFAVPMKEGIAEGSRRYLFTIRARQAMFGIVSDSLPMPYQLLAVSIEETELLKVSIKDFQEFLAEGNGEALTLVEGWIEQLGLALSSITPSGLPFQEEGMRYFSLSNGQIFQPQRELVSWVQIQRGYAIWMGFEQLLVTPQSGLLPLSADMWFEAEDTVELETLNTSEIKDANILFRGIFQMQVYFLQSLFLLEQQEKAVELNRFQERQHLNDRVMKETLGELSSLLQSPQIGASAQVEANDFDQALLIAAGAVGRTLGVTILPPAKSEDLKRVQDPLQAIARASRLRTRTITLQGQWWKKDCGAMLAYTMEDNRPVALLPVSDTRYEIFDPIGRSRTLVNAKSATKLALTGYTFYRPLPDKVLTTVDLLKFALQGHYKELLIVLAAGMATSLLGMIVPQATAILIDSAIPDANRGLLVQIALALLATSFGSTLFQLAQGFAIMRVETFADASTQAAVWDRLLNLKASFFRQYSTGDLNSRVSAISQIRQKLSSTVLRSIFTSLFAFLNLGLLFYYNGSLALIATLVASINIAITLVSGISTLRKVRPLLELQGQLSGVMVQLINGVSKLRVAGAEARAFAFWGKQYSQQIKWMLSTQGIEDILAVVNKILPVLTTAILFWFASIFLQQANAQEGGLSTGVFLAFNAAFGTFISGATSLSSTIIDVLQVVPLWERAQPILESKPEVDSEKTDPGRLSGRLVVDHVIFRYRDDGPLTLDDVSIHAQPGEFIAFVGASGSGKSTLFRLLLGFDVPESGTIYYDGQDLAGLDIHAVRRQLGVVMQNSRLTSASIFENIASGAMITMDEAWEAARMAGFAEDVESMPMGMHTVISEGGTNISGGQRQRLLIARSLVLKPKILLFDEATSALDNRTQAIVSQSLERLKVTRIAIAHRLSTIRNADRIYVFENGRVVQEGNFNQLANQPGLFAQLMARQKL